MSFTRNVKVKEVNTFYFFKSGVESKTFSGRVESSYWCIVGSAQLPFHEDMFKRMKKNKVFVQKNNVFYIGSSEGEQLWHTPLKNENRIRKNSYGPVGLYMNELQEEALVITCEKCNTPPFYSCRTPKGYNCKTHTIRKSGIQQILFVGKRRTGSGSYYYHRKKMYLAENLDDVMEFISNPDEKNESKTSRKSIPDDVQIFVWKRDEGLCVKCGSNENLAFDHIIPHSLGGSDTRRNLQILCDTCNSKKGNKIGG
jgi:predicted nucleic-acid-binding Zn-ribbon protein